MSTQPDPNADHLDWTTLVEYHEGLLPPSAARQVEEHLASGCRFCSHLYQHLTSFPHEETEDTRVGETLGGGVLPDAPAKATDKARGLLDAFLAGELEESAGAGSVLSGLEQKDARAAELTPGRRRGKATRKAAATVLQGLAAPSTLLDRFRKDGRNPERVLKQLQSQLEMLERLDQPGSMLRGSSSTAQMKLDTMLGIVEILDAMDQLREAADVRQFAADVAKGLGETPLHCTLLRETGSAYFQLGEYQRGLGFFRRALHVARALDDVVEVYNNERNIGCVLSRMGNAREAVAAFSTAIELARDQKLLSQLSSDLHNLSIGYLKLGEFRKALTACDEALCLDRETGEQENQAYSLVNKGNILAEIGEYRDAITAYKESLALFTSRNDTRQVAMCLLNIGSTYNDLGRFGDALPYFAQSYALKEQSQDTPGMALNLLEKGRAERGNGTYGAAVETHRKAHALSTHVDSAELQCHAKYQLALDLFYSDKDEEAVYYGEQALDLLGQVNDEKLHLEVTYLLARVCARQNDAHRVERFHKQGRVLMERLEERYTDVARSASWLDKLVPGRSFFGQEFPRCLDALG